MKQLTSGNEALNFLASGCSFDTCARIRIYAENHVHQSCTRASATGAPHPRVSPTLVLVAMFVSQAEKFKFISETELWGSSGPHDVVWVLLGPGPGPPVGVVLFGHVTTVNRVFVR